MKLFEDKERVDKNYANNYHDPYKFYDNSAIEDFTFVRNTLNEWFSRYPKSNQWKLKRDFQVSFNSAFFELFIHELFTQKGFLLTPHPNVPNSTKRPDFLAQKGSLEIYLEAKVSEDESVSYKKKKNKLNIIYDTINQIECSNYWLALSEVHFISDNQVKLRNVKTFFQETINNLPPDFIYIDGYINEKHFVYKDEDVVISFSVIPHFESLETPIGIYGSSSYAYWGGADTSIRESVKEKSKRYGLLDKPYIVCINAISPKGTQTEDVYNAVLGRMRKTVDGLYSLGKDSIFLNSGKPSHTGITGIFVTRVFPSNISNPDCWLIKHPFADNKFDFESLELSCLNTHIVEYDL